MHLLSKDLGAGLLFMAAGVVLLWLGNRISFDTVMDIGPGFFPTVLAFILIVLGALITIKGMRDFEVIDIRLGSIRRLFFVTVSVAAFALLAPRLGLLPAIAATVLLSVGAGDRQSPLGVVLLCGAILAGIWLVFVAGLGIPVALVTNPL